MEDIKNIIESLLFVTEDPLTIASIKNVLEIEDPKEIRIALKELAEDYEQRNGAFSLHEVAGGFQIRTRPEYNQWVKRLIQPKHHRLSKAALETLAIIAYKQPIIRSDIEHIRGVDCGGVIRILLERKLIRVLGRKEIPGRPLIYGTTKQFLEVFDLKNLRDLPTPKEIEELRESAEEDAEPQTKTPQPLNNIHEQESQFDDDENSDSQQPEQPEEDFSENLQQIEGTHQELESSSSSEGDDSEHTNQEDNIKPDNQET